MKNNFIKALKSFGYRKLNGDTFAKPMGYALVVAKFINDRECEMFTLFKKHNEQNCVYKYSKRIVDLTVDIPYDYAIANTEGELYIGECMLLGHTLWNFNDGNNLVGVE